MNKRLVAVLAMLLITSAFVSAQAVIPAQYFGMHYVRHSRGQQFHLAACASGTPIRAGSR